MGTTNHGYNLILLHLAALKTNTANDIHMFNQPEDIRQSGWQNMVLSSCYSIKTFGLFTFYTTIPHSKLKGSFIKRMVNVYTNNLCQEGTDFIQIYHVWEGYLWKIPVERRNISRGEWRGKCSLKTGIFRKYPSQTWYICLITRNII